MHCAVEIVILSSLAFLCLSCTSSLLLPDRLPREYREKIDQSKLKVAHVCNSVIYRVHRVKEMLVSCIVNKWPHVNSHDLRLFEVTQAKHFPPPTLFSPPPPVFSSFRSTRACTTVIALFLPQSSARRGNRAGLSCAKCGPLLLCYFFVLSVCVPLPLASLLSCW